MNRRMSFALTLAITLGLGMFSSTSGAQSPPSPIYLVHPLKGGVYWIEGGAGSNNGFIVGDKGVIAIDMKTTVDSEKSSLAELAKITPKPITHVILTHSDSDHVNGLPALPAGLTIISQVNCKKIIEETSSRGGPNALPKEYFPTKTVDKMEALTIDGVHVVLLHWTPGHTSGDLIVYLPDQKIVFTGDAYNSRLPGPYIHLNEGGSAVGWIEEMKQMTALDGDLYVTGHGSLVLKSELLRSESANEKEMMQVRPLIAQGKSIDEIERAVGEDKAKPLQHEDGRPLPFFSEVLYQELAKQ
jgi:glyoxylase-like metal-dependent hydrolase (beta-lactamase superfamily II)